MSRSLAKFLVIAAVGFGTGYGVSSAVEEPSKPKPKVERVGIPPSAIKIPPESARTPDGAKPEAPPVLRALPRTLGGSVKHISTHGVRLIESFEGFSSCPYWDPYGRVWTRGYGETDFGGNFGGRCISRSFGESNLKRLVERQYEYSIRGMGVSFNQNQWDALCSFDYNLGAGIFHGSLRYSLQHHNPYPMLAYDRAGGVVLSGLARRRREEVALFRTPSHEESAAERKAHERRVAVANLHTKQHRVRVVTREIELTRARIAAIRGALRVHKCRTVHGKHAYRACPRWAHEGGQAHRRGHRLHVEESRLRHEIQSLERKGIH